ncbi:MAG TPA: L-arabinose ABC transporter ATP-binding protein AraG [Tepidisphaeraceae bacterium]|jgi:L-arabinose transport system ATP-binding protein
MSSSLRFENLSKSFPGVRALSDVSFNVQGGKVHALMGENGAGKSTLLKILSGLYQPDEGQLILDGQACHFHSTADALGAGVAVIYQELQLVPELSVAENLYLGHLPASMGWVKGRQLREAARGQLAALGEEVDPRAKVGSLPIAQRQMIEIAKALTRNARVIAFDEPTSSLSSREVEKLFAVIEKLRAQGRVILYVTHRMEEVYRICDAATVLRDGRHVETFEDLKAITADTLVNRMVGRSISDVYHYSPREVGKEILEVKDVEGPGLSAPCSFSVRSGEILGIFGLVGAGRTELLKLLYGATRTTAGTISVGNKRVHIRHPSDAIAAGIVLCPEDRKKEGIIPIRSVMENMNISSRRHFSTLGFIIRAARERENASKYVKRLAVKTPSLSQLIMHLSGGNQQKVILGRWLGEKIQTILFDEPTRGIDVGAKSEIYSIIYDLARSGVATVVVSSELPEVLGVSDRILVMRQGKIVADLPRDQATPERVLQLALPVATEAAALS